jgi:hypothetical protein
MSIDHPYRRTCRQFKDGQYYEGGRWRYLIHPKYAKSPEQYVRAFLLIQKDLQELLDYIEPADQNMNCYSYRIHALLMRVCIEVEANCKAVLQENGYVKSTNLNMNDYKKINITHRLSSYHIKIPFWNGVKNLRSPFLAWATGGSLGWYQTYNVTKHDRRTEFEMATFDCLIEAVCGLLVVLSAQFGTEEFSPGPTLLATEGPGGGMEHGIGSFFQVRFPTDWPDNDRYDFNWDKIENEEDPFQSLGFTTA